MRQSTLSVSIAFLLAGLIGGLVLITDLWMKNAPSATVAIAARGGTASPAIPLGSGQAAGPPTLDGTIAEGEYANALHDEVTGMSLYWSIVGGKLYLGLKSPGHGWTAVGFDPDGPMMKGADILIGYVKDGQAFARDHYADTPYTHKADEELGGTDDIEEFAGSEGESGTTLEWVRPLQTDDPYDKPLEPGEGSVLLAYAAEKDDWVTYHKGRSRVTINFFSGTGGSGP
jgi:hypothetical protein